MIGYGPCRLPSLAIGCDKDPAALEEFRQHVWVSLARRRFCQSFWCVLNVDAASAAFRSGLCEVASGKHSETKLFLL
jgi:hypothetical protein